MRMDKLWKRPAPLWVFGGVLLIALVASPFVYAKTQAELLMEAYQSCFNRKTGVQTSYTSNCTAIAELVRKTREAQNRNYGNRNYGNYNNGNGNYTNYGNGTSGGGGYNSGGSGGGSSGGGLDMNMLMQMAMMSNFFGNGGMGGSGGTGSYGSPGGGYSGSPGGGTAGEAQTQGQACIPVSYDGSPAQKTSTLQKATELIQKNNLGAGKYNRAACQGVNCECASLTKKLACISDPASTWRPGVKISDNWRNIPVGTAMATFNNGRYGTPEHPGGWYGRSHTGIFMGANANGIMILEQYNSSGGARMATIPWSKAGFQGADKYHTIVSPNGAGRCDGKPTRCKTKEDEEREKKDADKTEDGKTDGESTPPASDGKPEMTNA